MAADVAFDLPAYLARIGLDELRPDAAGLRALQQAHLLAVPFENFDPLLGKLPVLETAELFAKIVHARRGGYCFELNGLFEAALKAAGFKPVRRLARVRMRFGPEGARSHLVLVVEIEGRSFLADVGFGGPGPLVPIDLGIEGEQRAPNGTFRVSSDAMRGETVLERFGDGGWKDLYAFDCARVSDGEVATANFFCANWEGTPFGSHLLLGCYRGETRLGLFDHFLTIKSPAGEERLELTDFPQFVDLVESQFGLALGREELEQAWDKIQG